MDFMKGLKLVIVGSDTNYPMFLLKNNLIENQRGLEIFYAAKWHTNIMFAFVFSTPLILRSYVSYLS